MIALQLFPVVLSLVVLGAHFLRAGNLVLVAAVLLVVALLLAVRRPWVARAAQATLALGALEWGRTLALLATERAGAGGPVLRLVVILGVVTAATALSALLFATARLRRAYGLAPPASSTSSA